MRTDWPGCHAVVSLGAPAGKSITTVEPSMKRPISAPRSKKTPFSVAFRLASADSAAACALPPPSYAG